MFEDYKESQKGFFQRQFTPIESKAEAEVVADDAATIFFFFAVVNALFGLLLNRASLIDAAIYAVLAWLLRKMKSRIAAILLLCLSCLAILRGGGLNILVAILAICNAVRGIQATFKYWKESSV